MRIIKRYLKKIKAKLLQFIFENSIDGKTWINHDRILEHAIQKSNSTSSEDCFDSILITRGAQLREEVLSIFRNKYIDINAVKILIHVPPKNKSPGGNSLFMNLIDAYIFLGIPCRVLNWNDDIQYCLDSFKPTIFLSSDNDIYINKINWGVIKKYKSLYPLKVGLTASLEEYGNTSLSSRLSWAKKNQIDFYYSFRSIEYFSSREEYSPFFSEGFEIYPIEFGANPLIYYPVYSDVKDCDFVFLASSNQDKQQRYSDWLQPLLRKYSGFLDGPGWSKINQYADRQVHRYIYSRAKVGINLHIDDSVDWASELNERTYILAACGVPQLIDNPKLLNQRFSRNSMFQADTPKEYYDLFKHIINSPEEAGFKALSALEEVYKKHTTFHRADAFLRNFINK